MQSDEWAEDRRPRIKIRFHIEIFNRNSGRNSGNNIDQRFCRQAVCRNMCARTVIIIIVDEAGGMRMEGTLKETGTVMVKLYPFR